jgi:hypothetical protein
MRRRARAPSWGRNALLIAAIATTAFLSAAAQASDSERATSRDAVGTAPPSTDPYTASLAYAGCLRRRGVPHPDPDRRGDFRLTPADERRLRRVGAKKRAAAERACFHHLKGLNLRPLSRQAIARAEKVVADLGRCLRRRGHRVGAPDVRNLGRGRASFGFKPLPYQRDRAYWQSAAGRRKARELARDGLACEKQVSMAQRLTKIVNEDRRVRDL